MNVLVPVLDKLQAAFEGVASTVMLGTWDTLNFARSRA